MQANSGGQQQGQQGQQGPQGQQGLQGQQGQQVQQVQQAAGQQQPNQQQVATGGTGGGATTRRVCGSKPPKFTEDGGFDLYQAQVEGYLVQHGCWDVVAGNAVANPADPQWVERNQFARYALLFGMLPKDSKKVCKMATAREMWTAFEQDKTKRAYASEIRLRRDLYAAKFQPGEGMEAYLDRLEGMRRQLANMNAVISDADMVNIVLQGVVDSHRNVVRLFNRNNTGVAPDLATVVNVLRGEDETDKACAAEAPVKEQAALATKVMAQRLAPLNPKKRFKKRGGSGKKVNDETRKCFFCKKKGHLRADCYGWKALQAKKGNESDTSDCMGKRATPLKLVWSGELGDFNNQPVPIRMAWGQDDHMPDVNPVHDWMLDGGAGAHVCVNANSFTKLVKDPLLTIDWQGGLDTNERSGLIVLEVANGKTLELHGVRYAPGGVTNLISQRLLERTGWKPSYFDTNDERQRSKYFDKNDIRLEFKKRADGFYWMIASPVLKLSVMAAQSVETLESNVVMRWHLKLAHLNEAAMKKMVKEGLADGMDGLTLDSFKKTPLRCIACEGAKSKRMAFKRQEGKRATECCARLMSDVCYVGITTPGGARYFQLVQDEASRFKWVFLLQKKSEAAGNVMTLVRQLEKDFKVKMFSSDQGGEFLNTKLTEFLSEHGIRLLTTNAYTPEENCLVEKLNGKLLSKVRAIRDAANLPACLWGEILHYVVYVDNLSVTKALGDMTPQQKLWNRKPDLKNLKVCGCVAYYHVPKVKQSNKLEMRAKPAVFLGIAESTLGYRLLDLETGNMIQQRSVHFREDVAVGGDFVEKLMAKRYYGKRTVMPTEIPYVLLPVKQVAVVDDIRPTPELDDEEKQCLDQDEDVSMSSSDESDWEMIEEFEPDESHGGACGATAARVGTTATAAENVSANVGSQTAGTSGSVDVSGLGSASPAVACASGAQIRSNAASNAPPTRTSTGHSPRAQATPTVRRSGRQRRPNSKFNPSTWLMTFTLMQCMLIGVVNDILNPTTRTEALASEHADGWSAAMDAEYAALIANGTWELVARPKPRKGRRKPNILTSVWVLVAKRNERGEVERLKARLAIRGFMQKFGIDYLATYSPVVRIESVRLVMLIAMFLGLECTHVDFVTAFLNGDLVDVVIYMEQPEGYEDGTDRVCRLRKGLYGLKQASKIWNDTLHKVLVELGFVQCTYDAGVYWRRRSGHAMFLTVYVDDIVMAGTAAEVRDVIMELGRRFKLKNLGRVRHLLGMEVNYMPGRMLCFSQTAYVERLAGKFGLASARPVRSPQFHHEKTLKIETDESKINDPNLPYREIVGSLQYLVACTRPDLANAVRTLGRYMGAYTVENYRAAQRVVRYALATKRMGLVYRATPELPMLDAYCDADHQSCPETSRSVTGYLLRLHGNMWMWKSHSQRRVTEDTCGSELVACCECCKMVVWARELLIELGFSGKDLQVPLWCDNQSAIAVVASNGNTSRVRHMAKHARFINEYVQEEEVEVTYVPTADNFADVFTKALGPAEFERQRSRLNVEDVPDAWVMVEAVADTEAGVASNADEDFEMLEA